MLLSNTHPYSLSWVTAPLCLIFDGASRLQGAVRGFANKDSWGIMFSVEGYINLTFEPLKAILNWPKDGHSFYADLSIEVEGKAVEACFRKKAGKRECIATCSKDSQCKDHDKKDGKFCNLIKFCKCIFSLFEKHYKYCNISGFSSYTPLLFSLQYSFNSHFHRREKKGFRSYLPQKFCMQKWFLCCGLL